MQKVKYILGQFYYSLPIQIVVAQLRHHKFILFFWLFLFLVITGNMGSALGVPYLFLEPEYIGEVNLLSFYLLGCGLGAFFGTYIIVAYISDGFRFRFLALERSPFSLFFFNSLVIPIGFLVTYFISFIRFQKYLYGYFPSEKYGQLLALTGGIFSILLLIFIYFRGTNHSLRKVLGDKIIQELKGKRVILEKARSSMVKVYKVENYISGFFKFSKVDHSLPVDFRQLVRILNQNHGNALFLQLLFLAALMGLGLAESKPGFQLPAGASILLFFAVAMMIFSAITFWVRKFGPIVLPALLILYVVLAQSPIFKYRNPAYGMNYNVSPAPYNAERLRSLCSEELFNEDYEQGVSIFRKWKQKVSKKYNYGWKKPRAVFVCTSGGGLRASYFTFRTLQQLDSLTGGKLFDHTRLITGASGGMIGAAYYRELYGRRQQGDSLDLYEKQYANRTYKDLLNRISFKIVSSLFLPSLKVTVGSQEYYADRGYSFDEQLTTNLMAFQDKRLADYRDPELEAQIPMLILSPIVINDGRRMYISPISVSYLNRTVQTEPGYIPSVTGIELSRFFKQQWADSLLFVTALRMNASFPLITPYVQLPSSPPLQLIDAGVADNYGIHTASKFINVFQNWLLRNTERVLIIQIRDSKNKHNTVQDYNRKTFLDQLLHPIDGTYNSFAMSKDFFYEDYLSIARGALKDKLDYVSIEYEPNDTTGIKASLSWHLTKKEIDALEDALETPYNRENIQKIVSWVEE